MIAIKIAPTSQNLKIAPNITQNNAPIVALIILILLNRTPGA